MGYRRKSRAEAASPVRRQVVKEAKLKDLEYYNSMHSYNTSDEWAMKRV